MVAYYFLINWEERSAAHLLLFLEDFGKLIEVTRFEGIGQPGVVLFEQGQLVRVGPEHVSDHSRVILVGGGWNRRSLLPGRSRLGDTDGTEVETSQAGQSSSGRSRRLWGGGWRGNPGSLDEHHFAVFDAELFKVLWKKVGGYYTKQKVSN